MPQMRKATGQEAQAHGSHFPAHEKFSTGSISSCFSEGHVRTQLQKLFPFSTVAIFRWASVTQPLWNQTSIALTAPVGLKQRLRLKTCPFTCSHSYFFQAEEERIQDCYH